MAETNERKPKQYYVFKDGKFEKTTVDRTFFEANPVLWSARLSTGLFGLTACPAGNRGPKNSSEVILGVGDEGLTKLVELGFIPCSDCNPELSPHFSWSAIKSIASDRYGVADAGEFTDKARVPYNASRLEWNLIINTIHGAPSRVYLPEKLDPTVVESFRTSIRLAVRTDGIGKEPALGYYDSKATDHFTEYETKVVTQSVDPKIAAEALMKLIPNTTQKKLYFAHAQPIYGTEEENRNLAAIGQIFPEHIVVNPAAIKDFHIRDMTFYLGAVDKCDAIVYTEFEGVLMGGVGKEVEHALRTGKEAFRLEGNRAVKVESTPKYLSHEETIAVLKKVGFRKD